MCGAHLLCLRFGCARAEMPRTKKTHSTLAPRAWRESRVHREGSYSGVPQPKRARNLRANQQKRFEIEIVVLIHRSPSPRCSVAARVDLMAFELVGLACARVHFVVDYGPRGAPTHTDRPVCVRPQRWDDDGYLGPTCEDYKCTSFRTGTKGKTCNCKTQNKTHILKIARPGHYCALGDEWNTLHRLVNASCVVKPARVGSNHRPAGCACATHHPHHRGQRQAAVPQFDERP